MRSCVAISCSTAKRGSVWEVPAFRVEAVLMALKKKVRRFLRRIMHASPRVDDACSPERELMVFAFPLPFDFPNRDLPITFALGAIVQLIAHGATMQPLRLRLA